MPSFFFPCEDTSVLVSLSNRGSIMWISSEAKKKEVCCASPWLSVTHEKKMYRRCRSLENLDRGPATHTLAES